MSDHHHHNHHGESHPHQLEPPHEVFHDPGAGEVLRAWITQGNLSLALHAMAFGKPEVWGHVLAGIAQNAAHALAEGGQGTMASNLEAIRKALSEDLAKAAAKHSPLANAGS
jgi:Domain of unknown function (DUF5076)